MRENSDLIPEKLEAHILGVKANSLGISSPTISLDWSLISFFFFFSGIRQSKSQ